MAVPGGPNLAPVPDVPERATNVIESKIGLNTRRAGQAQAHEGLDAIPAIPGSFVGAIYETYSQTQRTSFYERKVAGQAEGRTNLGARNPHPSWTDEDAYLAAFADGTNMRHSERRYESRIAPSNGGRGVRNDAEVTD